MPVLLESHTATAKVDLWYGGSPVIRDLPVEDGSVAGRRAPVRRTLDVSVTESNYVARRALFEALSKPGMELRAYRGVRYPDGSVVESPLGRFLVRKPQLDIENGKVNLSGCPDLMQRVVDARFETPRTSRAGFTFAQQIQSLVGEVVPNLRFRDLLRNGTAIPSAVWERDRVEAVAQVAIAAGGEAWFDPDGALVLGRIPTFADPAVWKLTTRTGNIVSGNIEVDWDSAYNIVVATGERSDGTPPIQGVARDTNPLSVTYYAGPMGPKPRFYSSPLLTSKTAAERAALTILLRSVGARKSISLETVANTDIDVASRIDVILPEQGVSERHIVDTFRLPLFSAGMSLTTRAVDAVEDGDA